MTRQLILREEVAFDVDRERMVQTLKHHKLADPLAYIRDILGAAAATDAKAMRISTSPRKITVAVDGAGMPFAELDEKLANMFTGEGLEELATGILCSFDAGVKEVVVESYPKAEGEQAYRLRITGDEEGNIHPSLPEVLEKTKKQGRTKKEDSGMKITMHKKQKRILNRDLFFWRKKVPELAVIESTCTGAYLDVILNRKKLEQIREEDCFVFVPVQERDITGVVGLKSFHRYLWRGLTSKISLYRKRLYHTSVQVAATNHITAYSAQVNCDRLNVDITGNVLKEDPVAVEAQEAVARALPRLYQACLDYQGKDQESKKKNLMRLLLLSLPLALSCYSTKKRIIPSSGQKIEVCLSSQYNQKLNAAYCSRFEPLQERLIAEKFFPTKNHGVMSLEDILDAYLFGNKVYLDLRGYDYRHIKRDDIVVCSPEDYVDDGVIKKIFSSMSPMNNHILMPTSRMERWRYDRFKSTAAQQLKAQRKTFEEKLRLPVLYRPAQAAAFWMDYIYPLKENGKVSGQQKRFTEFDVIMAPFLVPVFLPIVAVSVAGGLAYGTLEMIAKTGLQTAEILKDPTQRFFNYLRADARETYHHNKLLPGKVRVAREGLGYAGRGLALSTGTAGKILYTGGRYAGKGLALGAGTAGKILYTGGQYAWKGTAITAKTLGKGALVLGKGTLYAGGIVGAAAVTVISAPFVAAYHGARVGGDYTARGVDAVLTKYQPSWESFKTKRREKKEHRKVITFRLKKEKEARKRAKEEARKAEKIKKYEQRRSVVRKLTLRKTLSEVIQLCKKIGYDRILLTTKNEDHKNLPHDQKTETGISFSLLKPIDYDKGEIYVSEDATVFARMTDHFCPDAAAYVGTLILKEGMAIGENVQKFQLAYLSQQEQKLYQQCADLYSKGNGHAFRQKLECLPRYAQENVLGLVLGVERQPSIDAYLEEHYAEQLQQAGRKRIQLRMKQ